MGIRKILTAGLLHRTVIVFPPLRPDEVQDRWEAMSGELHAGYVSAVPSDKASLLAFSANSEPICVVGKRKRGNYDQEAIHVAARMGQLNWGGIRLLAEMMEKRTHGHEVHAPPRRKEQSHCDLSGTSFAFYREPV